MTEAFARDAIKGSLVTCSLAMIFFPPGAVGMAATMGVAVYLDAACTNILDEIFGEGLYGEILNSCGYITAVALNSVELLSEFKNNISSANQYNRVSESKLSEIKSNRTVIETKNAENKKLLEEL